MPITKIKNVLVKQQDLGVYTGDIAVHVPELERKPHLHFHGTPMPLELWRKCLAFMKWSYDTHKAEAQLRFFYNERTGEWKAAVMPQQLQGMTTLELTYHEDRAAILEEVGVEFHPIGSLHHHCGMPAFQSRTDYEDELKQNGLHITVGTLQANIADFHARLSFRKVMYKKVRLSQWFERVGWEYLYLRDLPEFPEEWKTRLIEPPPRPWRKDQQKTVWRNGAWQRHDYENAGFQPGARDWMWPEEMPVLAYSPMEHSKDNETKEIPETFQELVDELGGPMGFYLEEKIELFLDIIDRMEQSDPKMFGGDIYTFAEQFIAFEEKHSEILSLLEMENWNLSYQRVIVDLLTGQLKISRETLDCFNGQDLVDESDECVT